MSVLKEGAVKTQTFESRRSVKQLDFCELQDNYERKMV